MATLAGKTIANTYTSLLKLEDDTQTLVAGGGAAIQIKTGDDEVTPLYLNTDRVGIGTDSPNESLEVAGVGDQWIRVSSTDDAKVGLEMYADSDEAYAIGKIWVDKTGPSAGVMHFSKPDGGSENIAMSIKSTGGSATDFAVGIGTVAPDCNLHIGDANVAKLRLEKNDDTISEDNEIGSIDFEHQETGNTGLCARMICLAGTDNGDGEFSFQTGRDDILTHKVRIDYNGNVGIGTTSPGWPLDVSKSKATDVVCKMNNSSGTSPRVLHLDTSGAAPNDATAYFIYAEDSAGQKFTARSNGGLANYSANDANLASDERLKKDIAPLVSHWNKLKQLEVVTFKYKDQTDDTDLYGMIAQKVKETFPEFSIITREATETDPEYYGLREKPIWWITTKVLQEAMVRIESLETKADALENNNQTGDSNNDEGNQGNNNAGEPSSESAGEDSGGAEGSGSDSSNSSDGESASSEPSSDDGNQGSGSSGSDASDDSAEGSGGDDSSGSFPEGEPSDGWTKEQLKAYMDAQDPAIIYNSGDTKQDLLDKIGASNEG